MRSRVGKLALASVLATAALVPWTQPVDAAESFEKYALETVSASLSSTQAGAHADLTTEFKLTDDKRQLYALTRDVEVHLPPGLNGNPQGIPRCSIHQLAERPGESECPVSSQVGVAEVTVAAPLNETFIEPIYNMAPPAEGSDIVARLGFFAYLYPAFINVRVNPSDFSLVASVEGAPSAADLLEVRSTIWGVPAAQSHDFLRLTPDEAGHHEFPSGGRSAGLPPAPFLSNPADCSLERRVTFTARSYQRPDLPSTMSAAFPQITGCQRLTFAPSFTAIPTNPEAAAPTGLEATLTIPQDETPQGLATSALKSSVVTLPAGMTINPAAGEGLAGCSAEEVGYQQDEPSHCPDAARIGSLTAIVPALERPLHGSIYQRSPRPGRLFGLWLVADEQGVHLKLPVEVETNPLTGQLSTVVEGFPALGGIPEVPVEELRLQIEGGAKAPLATPSSCGTYQTHYSFVPWSGRPAAEGDTAMRIASGCQKGGFNPGLVAGTLSNGAGEFSPLTFTLTRRDGEANPQSIALHLPQGLLAKLSGVGLCPESGAATGACPADSRIGAVTAAAGVGGAPLWIPQPGKAPTAVYLAGPYRGAPYSAVAVVPAQAGPFDLGTVVTRSAIEIDPETALATVKTDPLPQILEGVPIAYRTLNVLVDRPNFTLNPTSCARKQIVAAVTASNGASAEPAAPFQATDCAKLAYAPKLKLSFKGQTKRTGHPAVRAVLTQKPHQANTKAAVVLLPKGEFIDNAHITTPCTRVQFNAGKCPKGSILGHVRAVSPLLSKPLKGPIYFRSNGGERELPDIVADLRGQIHIILVGYIDSVRTGRESSRVRVRFLHVPDAPVTKAKFNFFGGKKGLLQNSVDVCRHRRRAEFDFRAQNGKRRVTNPAIRTRCRGRKR